MEHSITQLGPLPQDQEVAHAPFSEHMHRAAHVVGNVMSGAFVAAELNPITNEGARVAAFAATEALLDSPIASASAFAAATFAIEAAGSIATAKLLDTQAGQKVTDKMHTVLEKTGLNRVIGSSPATEAAVAMTAGVPLAIALKHQQNPERTRHQNIRRGLALSLGIAAVTGAESFAAAEGISHPSTTTIGGALLGAGVLAAGYKWAKERFIPRVDYDAYHNTLAKYNVGPELDGYQHDDFMNAIEDTRTSILKVRTDGKRIAWPLLAPIEHNTEYVKEYFDKHYGPDEQIYYLSLPPRELTEKRKIQQQIAEQVIAATREGKTIVFDELDGAETLDYVQGLVHEYDPTTTFSVDDFIDPKNNTPATVAHYHGLGHIKPDAYPRAEKPHDLMAVRPIYEQLVASGEIDVNSPNKTVLLDPEKMDQPLNEQHTVMSRLCEIYEGQFSRLIENYPLRGAQTAAELEKMCKDPGTFTAAHMVDGDIISFTMFVTNPEACDWLNTDFYKKKFAGENMLYFPGIATDEQKKGGRYSMHLINLLTDLVARSVDDVEVVFNCTNISEKYIPIIVQRGISATGEVDMQAIEGMGRYNYFGLKLADLNAEAPAYV
jgi:hypothetical protein